MQSKKYKALLLDLDGTTIPSGIDGRPSAKVISAIQELSQRVPVCVVTGRNVGLAKPVLDELKIQHTSILCNGGVIYNPLSDEIISQSIIDPITVRKVISFTKKKHDNLEIAFARVQEDYNDKLALKDVLTIFLSHLTAEELRYYSTFFKSLSDLSTLVVTETWSGYPVIMASHVTATKQVALNYLLQKLEIKSNEVVAVGDAENDLAMVVAAGMGVAMGNAVEGLKSVADYIAPSVEEDGVAHVIDKFF